VAAFQVEHRVVLLQLLVVVVVVAVAVETVVVAVVVVAIISFADDMEAFVGQWVLIETVDGVVQQRIAMSKLKHIEPTRYLQGYQNWQVDLEVAVVAEKKRKKLY
jgi:hypothetical protein